VGLPCYPHVTSLLGQTFFLENLGSREELFASTKPLWGVLVFVFLVFLFLFFFTLDVRPRCQIFYVKIQEKNDSDFNNNLVMTNGSLRFSW